MTKRLKCVESIPYMPFTRWKWVFWMKLELKFDGCSAVELRNRRNLFHIYWAIHLRANLLVGWQSKSAQATVYSNFDQYLKRLQALRIIAPIILEPSERSEQKIAQQQNQACWAMIHNIYTRCVSTITICGTVSVKRDACMSQHRRNTTQIIHEAVRSGCWCWGARRCIGVFVLYFIFVYRL